MVFDFLKKGKIDLKLDKSTYTHGETINGSFSLKLKKPVNARALKVRLYSQRKTRDSEGRQQVKKLYEFILPISGEQEYTTNLQDYKFQLVIPEDNMIQADGVMGNVLDTINKIGRMMSQITWFIEVKLDIPKDLDISTTRQITVNHAPKTTNPVPPLNPTKTQTQGY